MNLETKLIQLCRNQVGASEYLERFEACSLPKFRSEDYQRTDVCKMLNDEWSVCQAEIRSNIDEFTLPEGMYFTRASELKNKSLPKIQDQEALSLLACSFMPNAQVLYLSKDVKFDGTLDFDTIYECSVKTLSAQNLYLVLEEGAELHLIRRNHSLSSMKTLNLDSVHIFAGAGSRLCFTDIDNTNDLTQRISSLYVEQEAGSDVAINNFSLRSGRTRNNFTCRLLGEGAKLNLGGLVLNDGFNHVDNFSFIAHEVPNCISNELFKYILQDESYGVFTGRILVALDAQKTQAHQNNRNLLLSPSARMQSKPQLEIYADDVKCSHGMTTGQMDADALFYMRQRGLSLDEAKRLLSIAFASDVLAMLRSDVLRERVLKILSDRLS